MMNLWGSTQAGGDVESTVMIDGGVKAKKKKIIKSVARVRSRTTRVYRSRWSYQRLINDHM